MSKSSSKIEFVPRYPGSPFNLIQPYELAELGTLSREKVDSLQKLISSQEFEKYMRPPAGKYNPRGRDSVEMWEWVCSRLGFSKEEMDSIDNIHIFNHNLAINQLITFKKTDQGWLWFHTCWC